MILSACLVPLIAWLVIGVGEYFLVFSNAPSPGCYISSAACSLTLIMLWGALRQILFGSELNKALVKAESRQQPQDGQVTAAIGTIHPIRDALTAPISGQRCAAFTYDAFQDVSYEDADNHTQTREDVYFSGFALTPSVIKTMYGEFKMLGFSILDKFPQTTIQSSEKNAESYQRFEKYLKENPPKDLSGSKVVSAFSAINELMSDDDGTVKIDWAPKSLSCPLTDLNLRECILAPGTPITAFGIFDKMKQGILPRKGMNPFPIQIYPGGGAEVRAQLKSQTITMIIFSVVFFAAAHGGSWLAFKSEISQSIERLISYKEQILK